MRIGNGAADQLQLDIYGEAIDSLYFGAQHGLEGGHRGWRRMCDVLSWLTDNWNQPEEGIWETRGGRQDFTYGRLMSWVAFDRGIRLAEQRGRPAPLERWRTERDAIYEQIMTIVQRERPLIYLYHPVNYYAVSKQVEGVQVFGDGLIRAYNAGFAS